MPHFKMNFHPSSGKELQSEYFVPIEHAYDAMIAVETLHDKITPHLVISEIRAIKADDLWMSPCYKQDCVGIHFTWKQDLDAVQSLLLLIEKKLESFHFRPHWGKLFIMSPSVLQSRFEKLADFQKLLKQYDPTEKFRNDFIDTYLFSNQVWVSSHL